MEVLFKETLDLCLIGFTETFSSDVDDVPL
jgi:hypothetical protein